MMDASKKCATAVTILFLAPIAWGDELAQESFLQNRIDKQLKSTGEAKFALMPYKRNYIVYSSLINGINEQPYIEDSPDVAIDGKNQELQLQVSIMVPVWNRIFDTPLSIYGGYTNRSFWQVFAENNSQPFRETNHEPELWLWYHYDLEFGGLNLPMVWLGYNHQSNGKWEPLSRGWDRIFAQFFASYYAFDLQWKPWITIGETDTYNGLNGRNIEDYTPYMGDGELALSFAYEQMNSTVFWNYSFSGIEYGGITADLEIPITDYLSLYGRYFYGYGESLIDMDYVSNTASIGFCINDWQ